MAVSYRTITKTFTIAAPTTTPVVDVRILNNSNSVTAIDAIIKSDIRLLSKNSDGSLTFQVVEVQSGDFS